VNVDRMRRYAGREETASVRQERERWLATLTPEHRQVHERRIVGLCGFCLDRQTQEASAALARLADSVRRP
jgi:hypothetical protein